MSSPSLETVKQRPVLSARDFPTSREAGQDDYGTSLSSYALRDVNVFKGPFLLGSFQTI